MKTKILTTNEKDIELAGEILRNGGLVAFPTETVYGLGADALNEEAVRSIYVAKGRPSDNPLIVHVAEIQDIKPLVERIPPNAQALIDAFFPAPLTIILKKSKLIGNVVSGGLQTVAVRMPQNEIAQKVIKASGCPIAAPSANTSGLPSPTKAKYVINDMQGKIDAIIDGGDCEFGVESTVITFESNIPTILRPGAITKEMIEKVIGEVAVAPAVFEGLEINEEAASPGMKYKHYAPKARVIIVNADKEKYEEFVNSKKNAFALCFDDDNITVPKVTYGKENDDSSQARELFDALRKLDELGAKKVYARIPSKTGVGMAVYNRLIRAAAFNIIDLKKPFLIGLTGPTGAGKSYICEKLAEKGFNIVSADKIARMVVEKNSPLLPVLAKEFGDDIIKEDGELNRELLAKRAFWHKQRTQKLNDIMHPAIMEQSIIQADGYCVFDASQLFEARGQKFCSKVVSVLADKDLRINRITKRDGITKEQAEKRINVQFDDEFFINNSDFVIYNNGEDVDEQIDEMIESIL